MSDQLVAIVMESPDIEIDCVVDYVVAVSDTEDEQFEPVADTVEYSLPRAVPSFGEAAWADPNSVGSSSVRILDHCVDHAETSQRDVNVRARDAMAVR